MQFPTVSLKLKIFGLCCGLSLFFVLVNAFADLKSGMSLSNVVFEHKRRAYLIAGAPVKQNGEVVGTLAIGQRLERLFAEFKSASDDDPKKQVELALIDNQETLAAAAHAD